MSSEILRLDPAPAEFLDGRRAVTPPTPEPAEAETHGEWCDGAELDCPGREHAEPQLLLSRQEADGTASGGLLAA